MGLIWLKKFKIAILVFSVAMMACNSNLSDEDLVERTRQLSVLENMMGIDLPVDSKIVYADNNGRNNESYQYHIIYSPSPVIFNSPPVAKTPAVDSIKLLKEELGSRDLGDLKEHWTYNYEGKVRNGDWRAHQTHFNSGSYLIVKQVFLE